MYTIDLNLPETEFERLNALYPPTVKSFNVGERAIELVKFHFRARDSNCEFRVPNDGTDLEVVSEAGSERIEVKGTADSGIAWSKLKVSGNLSHACLHADAPLYRVVGVYDRAPRIHVLKHSEDFEMIPEARWAVKARR